MTTPTQEQREAARKWISDQGLFVSALDAPCDEGDVEDLAEVFAERESRLRGLLERAEIKLCGNQACVSPECSVAREIREELKR